jgi:hypothetical protein
MEHNLTALDNLDGGGDEYGKLSPPSREWYLMTRVKYTPVEDQPVEISKVISKKCMGT